MNIHLKMLSSFNVVRLFCLSARKSQKKNHYDCLGITPKATQGDIKDAYYKLSKEYHPDKNADNPSAAAMFRDITEAYETLGNVKSRKLYDRGVSLRGHHNNDYQTDEPSQADAYQHASFYHHRNKPTSTKSGVTGKSRVYDMDEWTKAHYSEMFTKQTVRKQEGHVNVAFRATSKEENLNNAFVLGLIVSTISIIFMYTTDASPSSDRFDHPGVSEEKPD